MLTLTDKLKGKLIVLSGIDGVGKSTHAKKLIEDLEMLGVDCEYVHLEFSDWIIKLKEFFRKLIKMKKYVEIKTLGSNEQEELSTLRVVTTISYRFLSCWTKIVPLKLRRKCIVADRYAYGSLLTLMGLGYTQSWIRKINYLFPQPDITLILDAPASVVYKRKSDVKEHPIEYYAHLRELYLKLAKLLNLTVIDSTRDFKFVHQLILKTISHSLRGD